MTICTQISNNFLLILKNISDRQHLEVFNYNKTNKLHLAISPSKTLSIKDNEKNYVKFNWLFNYSNKVAMCSNFNVSVCLIEERYLYAFSLETGNYIYGVDLSKLKYKPNSSVMMPYIISHNALVIYMDNNLYVTDFNTKCALKTVLKVLTKCNVSFIFPVCNNIKKKVHRIEFYFIAESKTHAKKSKCASKLIYYKCSLLKNESKTTTNNYTISLKSSELTDDFSYLNAVSLCYNQYYFNSNKNLITLHQSENSFNLIQCFDDKDVKTKVINSHVYFKEEAVEAGFSSYVQLNEALWFSCGHLNNNEKTKFYALLNTKNDPIQWVAYESLFEITHCFIEKRMEKLHIFKRDKGIIYHSFIILPDLNSLYETTCAVFLRGINTIDKEQGWHDLCVTTLYESQHISEKVSFIETYFNTSLEGLSTLSSATSLYCSFTYSIPLYKDQSKLYTLLTSYSQHRAVDIQYTVSLLIGIINDLNIDSNDSHIKSLLCDIFSFSWSNKTINILCSKLKTSFIIELIVIITNILTQSENSITSFFTPNKVHMIHTFENYFNETICIDTKPYSMPILIVLITELLLIASKHNLHIPSIIINKILTFYRQIRECAPDVISVLTLLKTIAIQSSDPENMSTISYSNLINLNEKENHSNNCFISKFSTASSATSTNALYKDTDILYMALPPCLRISNLSFIPVNAYTECCQNSSILDNYDILNNL